MNTMLIKSVPPGNFEEVSIHMLDWQVRFLKLVQERKPVKYDVYTMPTLSKDIQDELSKQHYCHLILESDHDKHFLTPIETQPLSVILPVKAPSRNEKSGEQWRIHLDFPMVFAVLRVLESGLQTVFHPWIKSPFIPPAKTATGAGNAGS